MNSLKPDILFKVYELFQKKKWSVHTGTNGYLSRFDRYCKRLELLSEEQQNLIINLTYKYTIVGLPIYLESFYDSLFSLGDEVYSKFDYIMIYPLLSPSKPYSSRTKSAGFLHYMVDTDDYTWISEKIITKSSEKFLKYNFKNENSLLILVDDFVGSGETAINICQEYMNIEVQDGFISPNNIKVVSIAAMKGGIEAVNKELGIDVVSDITFKKGISETFFGRDKISYTTIMESIDTKLNVQDDFLFGYKKSEALVTMLNKTPNNTFPVFWYETKNKVAPFPRQKNYRLYGK